MGFLYSLAIFLLRIVLRLASLFSEKAKLSFEGRSKWKEQLQEIPKTAPRIWMHCASLGEFDQGLPVLFALKEKFPEHLIIVTFFSPSGMEHYQKRNHCVDYALYLPLDTQNNAVQFAALIQADYALFVKYEFWRNIIREVKKSGTKMISIATLLRPKQIYFTWYGGFFKAILFQFDFYFVQNKETLLLLNNIGITNTLEIGDPRFDKVLMLRDSLKTMPENSTLSSFLRGQKAIIVGSAWKEEARIILEYAKDVPTQKIIIAPHDISLKNCESILNLCDGKAQFYTKYKHQIDSSILILDTIGHLSSAYNYAKLAFIGGGFSGKLHNILEPAVFGLPIIFGPKYSRFPEAEGFLSKGFAKSIHTSQEFIAACNILLEEEQELESKIKLFVEDQKGAAMRIVSHSIFNQ
jgi:3-deoxy-D-manno-octulosonic-acid transferase